MNYYERHLGDYAKDAGHLSLVEHGAYTLLLDRYYATEKPIPKVDAYRVCRASSRQERAAVDRVLAEFFTESPDGWQHKRCDQEIERYRESEPEREAKKENERERQRRSRQRRREMFEELRTHGVVPAYDLPMHELQAELQRVKSRGGHAPVTRDVTGSHAPVTRLQTVLPTSPPESRSPPGPAQARARDGAPGDVPRETETISPAGQACRQMREAGCLDVNPSHPNLLAALAEGVTPDQLRDLALELPGKRFAYLIATARSRRVDVPLVSAAGGGAAAPVLQTWTPPDDETPEERPRA